MGTLRRVFIVSCVAWVAALPIASAAASARDSNLAHAFAFGVYAIGSLVCHQLPARSFLLWSAPMPVCARCAGIYFGAAFTASLVWLAPSSENPRRTPLDAYSARLLFAAAAVPTVVTLAWEWTTGMATANWTRAIAGLPLGAAVAYLIIATGWHAKPGLTTSSDPV